MAEIGYFHLTEAKIGDAPVTISRTGFTGDLGYEIWVGADDAMATWDTRDGGRARVTGSCLSVRPPC